MNSKKIAIIYDWIDSWGGVERLLLHLHDMFPEADFYTSYYDEKKASWAKNIRVIPSFIHKLPAFIRKNRIISLLLYPYAFESFELSEYDFVISVTSSFAKAVITKPGTKHICYLLTPPRYIWGMSEEYIHGLIKRLLSAPILKYLREWDYIAAQRPDEIISLSHAVADRCKKYYGRESEVIYPPFDLGYWEKIKASEKLKKLSDIIQIPENKKYCLVVSRLEPYKKVDIAIKAFANREEYLVIVGSGTSKAALKTGAGENIIFVEGISDEDLGVLYQNAQALIMPQEEDFGYVSLEAQFFGCPVIAYNKGGASETVIDGVTGSLFPEQSVSGIHEGLARFHTISYNDKTHFEQEVSKKMQEFSLNNFQSQLAKHVS